MLCLLYAVWFFFECSSSGFVFLVFQVVLQVSSGRAVLRGVCVRAGVRVTLRAAAASVPSDGQVQPVNWVSD